MQTSTIVLIVLVVTVLWLVMLYNRLVGLRQTRSQSISDIDVQLKQRYDLIPNLVETVKAYAAHEKGVLESVTEARTRAMNARNTQDKAQAEGALGMALTQLFAVAENYPQLRANENFLSLQNELSDIENKIAAARRFLNNATSEYNTATQQFPAVLIARMFGFGQETFFDVPEAEKAKIAEAPKVNFRGD